MLLALHQPKLGASVVGIGGGDEGMHGSIALWRSNCGALQCWPAQGATGMLGYLDGP